MNTTDRRQQLMIYIADAQDKKVNALYTLLESEWKEHTFTLTDSHKNILEERHDDYLRGRAEPKPWREVHNRIRNNRKSA